MESSVTIVILVIASLGACQAAPAVYGQPGTNALFLGTVDGKSYLADNTTYRNWADSKTYCESLGMRLATVTSEEQRDFLDRIAESNILFQDNYWLAARDASSPLQFSWDYDNLPLAGNLHRFWSYTDVYTCVGYSARVDRKAFYSRPCQNGYGALCESV